MDKKLLYNTTYDYELADGSVVPLTLTFIALLQLKKKNKSLYERYNKAMLNMAKEKYDELDNLVLLYAAYVCANLDKEDILSEEEFIYLCGSDRAKMNDALGELTQPKKA